MATTTAATTCTPPRMRIAVIGGGIAGTALANGLQRIPHLETHVFEAAPEFSERGAALGLAVNSQDALGQLLPSVEAALAKARAVPMASTRVLVGSGPQAGTLIFDTGGDGGKVLHRASLLRELVATLPPQMLHTNKRLTAIDAAPGGGVVLTFDDGAVDSFDAMIGADGIFSFVRTHVLQDAAADCGASPAGFWDCRNVVPMDKARALLGAEYFDNDRQYGWCGDGAFIMHDVLEGGTMVQCVLSAVETDPPQDRKRLLTKDELKARYAGWGPVATGMIDLCIDQPQSLYGYTQMEHKQTPAYHRGRVCILGDAAHATTPWQGAGAGMAFEDAVVLVALLASVASPQDLDAAFAVYDAVRRPRGQRVVDSSRAVGGVLCGQDAAVGLDPEKMRETLMPRWGFIVGLDLEQHTQAAVEKLREMQAASLQA